MLKIEALSVSYGRISALSQASLEVPDGKVVALVGANGAGKSTLMWTIAGVLSPLSGRITYRNAPLRASPHAVAAMGIALVPERRRLFANLNVRENLMVGAFLRRDRQGITKDLDFVLDLFPALGSRLEQAAGTLSGGEAQMLAVGRALMSRPSLLCLDEPSLGLAPVLVQSLFRCLADVNANGTSILLAEQNAYKALGLAHYAYVLETGRVVLEGKGSDLLQNERVRQAYLGLGRTAD